MPLTPQEQGVIDHIERLQDELVRLLQDLVRIPSWDRETRGEAEVAQRIGKTLLDHKIESEYFASHPHIENLVSTWKGRKPGKRLLFNGHADVVPPGEDWTVDPFSGEIKNGLLYGRGTLDMKGGIAAMAMAISALRDLDIPLRGTVILNVVGDEERQGRLGTQWCIDNIWEKIRADACIVGEPSGVPHLGQTIGIGEKGPVWVKVTMKGEKAHGSVPLMGKNAIWQMFQLLDAFKKQGLPTVPPPITRDELVQQFASAMGVEPDTLEPVVSGKTGPNPIQAGVEALTQTTLNIGKIAGGVMTNVVPDRCETELDFRILPNQNPQEIVDALMALATQLGYAETCQAEIIEAIEGSSIPNYEEDPIVKSLSSASEELTGSRIYFMATFATDGRLLRAAGLTSTLSYGPGNMLAAHTVDEHIAIEDLVKVTKVYALTAMRYLGVQE